MSVNHTFQEVSAPLERLAFGYVKEQFEDSSGVRHIHVYREPQESPGESLWMVLEREDEMAPLELLVPEQW